MKKKSFLILIVFFAFITGIMQGQVNRVNSLMPIPAKLTVQEGKFALNRTFAASVKGTGGDKLYSAVSRAMRRLSGRTGLFFPQDYVTRQSNSDTVSFYVYCTREGEVKLGEDESYELKITPSKVELRAVTDLGVLRGVETLLQLLSVDENGYYFPAVSINDNPRYKWRGLMLDVSRHFMPVDMVKRNLDGMAAVKLNVMHWHLADDQGVRVESKVLPKLQQLSSDGLYYNQEQIKDIIHYANERGIRVVPEFDVPGHSTAFLTAYPELASAPGPYTIERNWGVFDPTFNPTDERTYEFFDKFLGEMASLFNDEYLHIGGDENNGKQWSSNEQIKEFMKKNNIKDNHALQAYFNQRLLKIVTKHGKKMIGWDEILHPDLPKNAIIQSWRGPKGLAEAAKAGHQVLLSNGYYIDLIQPTTDHYLNDPIPENSKLTEAEKAFVLGGEATMWAELVTNDNVDSRIWPRMAAVAERFWSPGSVKDIRSMYQRMELIGLQLEELGITYEKNYGMMLRRLTNYTDITALKNFVDVIEPVKIYTRHSQGVKYTSYSPYTRVVDAARPDARVARDFRFLVEDYLKNRDEALLAEISSWLTLWKNNHENLKKTITISPVLREVESMSMDLASVSDAGLKAVEFIRSGKKADKKWADDTASLLKKAQAPRGQAEIIVIKPVEALVNFAAGINQ